MYPNPRESEATDYHELVLKKKQAPQRAFELVRLNLNKKQKRWNIANKKNFKAQHTKKDN